MELLELFNRIKRNSCMMTENECINIYLECLQVFNNSFNDVIEYCMKHVSHKDRLILDSVPISVGDCSCCGYPITDDDEYQLMGFYNDTDRCIELIHPWCIEDSLSKDDIIIIVFAYENEIFPIKFDTFIKRYNTGKTPEFIWASQKIGECFRVFYKSNQLSFPYGDCEDYEDFDREKTIRKNENKNEVKIFGFLPLPPPKVYKVYEELRIKL